MNNQNCNILNWNIRGLNNPARRKVVSDLIKDTRSSVASIQETKLAAVNNQIVAETLGCNFVDKAYLPAAGTCGGALPAVDANSYKIQQSQNKHCHNKDPSCDFQY
jgi:hypothetical protein